MTNYVRNQITVVGDKNDLEALAAFLEGDESDPDEEKNHFDFNKVVPMPESLNIEAGEAADAAISLYLTLLNPHSSFVFEGVEKMDADEFELIVDKLNKKRIFSSYNADLTEEGVKAILTNLDTFEMEELIERGKTAISNMVLYGEKDWHDWRIENWGTKWNSVYTDIVFQPNGTLDYAFDTAWDYPKGVLKALVKMYPDLAFTGCYADTNIGYKCGRWRGIDGMFAEIKLPKGVSAKEFAEEIWDR